MRMSTHIYTRHVMDLAIDRDAPGIALVAHDACKQAMLEWARFNRETLSSYTLYTTGTTGSMLGRTLDLHVHRLLSGPHGGDAQVGALVAERRVRCVFFFWDPLTPQPHDVDEGLAEADGFAQRSNRVQSRDSRLFDFVTVVSESLRSAPEKQHEIYLGRTT